MGFTMEMHGAYLIMLICQFNQGKFTENSAVSLVGNLWESIKHKFENHEGLFWNRRLLQETEKRKEHRAHQRENIMKRWGKNDKPLSNKKISIIPSNDVGITMVIPLEDRNRNRSLGGIRGECFEEFWKLYPKKTGKGAAEKIWMKIPEPTETLDKIKIALEWQKKSDQWGKQDGQFIPLPATYLNQRRWEDERVKTNFERFAEGEIC